MDRINSSDDTIYISLAEDELEVALEEKLGVSKDDIKKLLHDFI
jgi:hypothetical protein